MLRIGAPWFRTPSPLPRGAPTRLSPYLMSGAHRASLAGASERQQHRYPSRRGGGTRVRARAAASPSSRAVIISLLLPSLSVEETSGMGAQRRIRTRILYTVTGMKTRERERNNERGKKNKNCVWREAYSGFRVCEQRERTVHNKSFPAHPLRVYQELIRFAQPVNLSAAVLFFSMFFP